MAPTTDPIANFHCNSPYCCPSECVWSSVQVKPIVEDRIIKALVGPAEGADESVSASFRDLYREGMMEDSRVEVGDDVRAHMLCRCTHRGLELHDVAVTLTSRAILVHLQPIQLQVEVPIKEPTAGAGGAAGRMGGMAGGDGMEVSLAGGWFASVVLITLITLLRCTVYCVACTGAAPLLAHPSSIFPLTTHPSIILSRQVWVAPEPRLT